MGQEIHKDVVGLLDATRGMWFDLFRLDFDRQGHQVQLPLSYSKRLYFQKLLTVTDVSDVAINGGPMTGEICDLQDIEVTNTSVRITSSVPLEVVLTTGDGCSIYLTDLQEPYRVRSIEINIGEAISSFLRFLRLKKPPS